MSDKKSKSKNQAAESEVAGAESEPSLGHVITEARERKGLLKRGEVRADGQFDVVWKTPTVVPGEAWSRYLPSDKGVVADWVTLKCGNYNTITKVCSGQNLK